MGLFMGWAIPRKTPLWVWVYRGPHLHIYTVNQLQRPTLFIIYRFFMGSLLRIYIYVCSSVSNCRRTMDYKDKMSSSKKNCGRCLLEFITGDTSAMLIFLNCCPSNFLSGWRIKTTSEFTKNHKMYKAVHHFDGNDLLILWDRACTQCATEYKSF